MAPEPSNRRKYPRIRAKGIRVRWKSTDGKTSAARLENVGLGGLYLHAANPAKEGTTIDLILDLPTGRVYARAMVRRSTPAKGMGLQFIQMTPDDRAKLHRYLATPEISAKVPAASAARSQPAKLSSANSQLIISPRREEQAQLRFEREVRHLIELTGRSSYYQLLGVTSECTASQVKKSFHSLARRFHPDNHPGGGELTTQLQELMSIIGEAYKTLANEETRVVYDKALAKMGALNIHRERRATEESVEGWIERANQCLRAKNFAGSIVWLRKCVEAAPEHALYQAMLARSLATLPQYYNQAIEHFEKAINLDPWKEPVYLQFAELLEKIGPSSRARGVYSRLLDVCPGHAKACERLAKLEPAKKDAKPAAWLAHLLSKKS